jgi:small subunit ribosomal protein S5
MGANLKVLIVSLKRSSRTVAGGRRFTFSALAVAGNTSGRVGVGYGRSGEVADAIDKAETAAVARMVDVSLNGRTIPHEVCAEYCGARVLLRPASPGTGLIASRTVRGVLECAGVKDAISKSLGTRNPANVVKATIQALMNARRREENNHARGLKSRKRKALILKLPDLSAGKGNPLQLN